MSREIGLLPAACNCCIGQYIALSDPRSDQSFTLLGLYLGGEPKERLGPKLDCRNHYRIVVLLNPVDR